MRDVSMPVGTTSPPALPPSTAMHRFAFAATPAFCLRDQAVVARHVGSAWRFSRWEYEGASAHRLFGVSVAAYQQGRHDAVNLTLRMNVLAVCAVFVFIGAIVLGAF